jgi:hypothetical protein
MGGFAQGFVQGMNDTQSMMADVALRKQQAELLKHRSKMIQLEADMAEKQLGAQAEIPKLLFKPPDQMPVQAQGPGAPVRLPMELSDNPTGARNADDRWWTEVFERGPGAYEEGPQPTGMADIPGTAGPFAHVSPQLQHIAQQMLVATGGDMGKTMSTLQMLAPGTFPQQPMFQKLAEGETLNRINPQTGQADVVAAGAPKYRAPVAVRPGGSLVDPLTGQPIYTAPAASEDKLYNVKGALVDAQGNIRYQAPGEEGEEGIVVPAGAELRGKRSGGLLASNPKETAGKPKDDIIEVNGVPFQVVDKDGQKTLQPIPGTPEAAGKSPTNMVDQYIFARSQGKYRNMAEAAAAGQTALVDEAERVVREQRPMERAEAQANIMTKAMAVREEKAEQIKQAQPLAPKERSNLFSRKAFMESGRLEGLPAGISKGEAARADVIELSDKQLGEIQALDNAVMDMNVLFKEADKLITAKSWKEAKFKQSVLLHGGAVSGANADAAAYKADVEAFSTNLARAFGHEKGVLTDQDIRRWLATLVTFGDTVATKEKKKSIFREIADNAVKAQRRVMAGDDLMRVRAELKSRIEPALRKADSAAGNGAPPPPAHIPQDQHQAYQEAYMEAMEQMGAVPRPDPRLLE